MHGARYSCVYVQYVCIQRKLTMHDSRRACILPASSSHSTVVGRNFKVSGILEIADWPRGLLTGQRAVDWSIILLSGE